LNASLGPGDLSNNTAVHAKVDVLRPVDLGNMSFQAVIRVERIQADRAVKDGRRRWLNLGAVSSFQGVQELPIPFPVVLDEVFPIGHD